MDTVAVVAGHLRAVTIMPDHTHFASIVRQDVETGQHRNPTEHAELLTTAYFHHPDELRVELEAAGLRHQATLAIEGSAWLAHDVRMGWDDPGKRPSIERVMEALRWVEAEPTLLGASAHLLAVGRKAGA